MLASLLGAAFSSSGFAEGALTILKSFGYPEQSDASPQVVIEGADGSLYGTARGGGRSGYGAIFRLNKDGSGHVILHHFVLADGGLPVGHLLQASDGNLYGTCGGGLGKGAVFSISTNGSGFRILRTFLNSPGDFRPEGGVIEAADGLLYGMTPGAIYRIGKDGTGFATIHTFAGPDGAVPVGLLQARDGNLYGATHVGGTSNAGTIFSLKLDGSEYKLLHNFRSIGTEAYYPNARLIEGSDDALYGTTSSGGERRRGTIFRIQKDGTEFNVIHSFGEVDGDGWEPTDVVEATDGTLYGGTLRGDVPPTRGVLFRINKDGSDYHILLKDSSSRLAPIYASDGLLYGANSTVFRIETNGGNFVVLRTFSATGGDGSQPAAKLVQGSDGLLYGTTFVGGSSNLGTVFALDASGSNYAILHSFRDALVEGAAPKSPILEASDGRLYGSTYHSGTDGAWGTLFSLSKAGTGFSVLHHFTPRSTPGQGGSPFNELVESTDDNLYGVTALGGNGGRGIVFRLAKSGADYSLVSPFDGTNSDSNPRRLLRSADGTIFGITFGGSTGRGIVFKFAQDGAYSLLHEFAGGQNDGAYPTALSDGSDGLLYGATETGGRFDVGTVFSLSKGGGDLRVIYSFSAVGGRAPRPNDLVTGADGMLYGTTFSGGSSNRGSVFTLNKNGTGFATLYSFRGGTNDADGPTGVIVGRDAALYGTTTYGGELNIGTVFRIIPPPRISLRISPSGYVEVTVRAVVYDSAAVEVSANLVHWAKMADGPLIDGQFVTHDLDPIEELRFYRAVTR